jgi:uncharacterized protein (TIGR00299 family) protein
VKIAYLDCFSGISGDMFLGALVDAGVPISVLQDALSALDLGLHLEVHRVNRSGIDSAKVNVLTSEGKVADQLQADPSSHTHAHADEHTHSHDHDHSHGEGHTHGHDHEHAHGHSHDHGRSLSTIQKIIGRSTLPEAVQNLALHAFQLLGDGEAKIHNVPVETIHFHEVGALDAIGDIVATAAGCHWLEVEQWICSSLNVGGGHVHCAHGRFPVPAPATLELLRDLPIYSSGVQKELVTPTGAALLRALNPSSGNFPPMRMLSTGYGAGSRDLPGQPNVLRLVVGESTSAGIKQDSRPSGDKVGIIEATIDDATPELLAYVADRLLDAGASDVHRTQVQMKKGRIGTLLTILCTPSRAQALQKILFDESTTLGLRYREEQKITLERTVVSVETEWGAIRVKLGLRGGEVINVAPEYEDCRAIAEHHSLPLKLVLQSAISAYQLQEAQR